MAGRWPCMGACAAKQGSLDGVAGSEGMDVGHNLSLVQDGSMSVIVRSTALGRNRLIHKSA